MAIDDRIILKLLARCIRVGRVSSVDTADVSARVTFPDHDDVVSPPLKIIMRGCKEAKDYWLPAVDDQVLCIYTADGGGKGTGAGYILGTIYSTIDAPPGGGSRVLNVPNDLHIHCGSLDITSESGDITVNGISLVNHTHGGVEPGGSNTGKPQ